MDQASTNDQAAGIARPGAGSGPGRFSLLLQFLRSRPPQDFYAVRFGGTTDTLHLLLLASVFIAASPYVSAFYDNIWAKYAVFSYVLIAASYASYYASARFLRPLQKTPLIPRQTKFRSAPASIAAEDFSASDHIVLGYSTDDGEPLIVTTNEFTQHTLVVGQSGVGKTVSMMFTMAQQILKGGALIFVDGKIDSKNKKMIWWLCNLAGRAQDFMALDLSDSSASHTYNPLFEGDYDEKASRIMSMIPEPSSSGSDHYRQEQLQGVMTVLSAYETLGWGVTPFELSVVLLDKMALYQIYEHLNISKPGSTAHRTLGVMLEKYKKLDQHGRIHLDIGRLKETFGGIAGRLSMFGDGHFGRISGTLDPDIRILEVLRNNKVLIVSMPTMSRKDTALNFAKLLIADTRSAIARLQALPEHERPNPPAILAMDEAASYAISAMDTMYEQARSAGLCLLAAIQTISGLEKVSEGFHTMVAGNSWIKMFFQVGEPETALFCASTIGENIQVLKSLSESASQNTSIQALRHAPESGLGEGSSLSVGERQAEAYFVSPTDLLSIGRLQAVVRIGEGRLYNITFPFITFSEKMQARIGPPRILRPRSFTGVLPQSPLMEAVFAKHASDFQRQQIDDARAEAEREEKRIKDSVKSEARASGGEINEGDIAGF